MSKLRFTCTPTEFLGAEGFICEVGRWGDGNLGAPASISTQPPATTVMLSSFPISTLGLGQQFSTWW